MIELSKEQIERAAQAAYEAANPGRYWSEADETMRALREARREALLEAAEAIDDPWDTAQEAADNLRRMAEEGGQ